MTTIKDIARVAGVSFSTVSKALRDSPLVQEATKAKIRRIAEELGYQPNNAARRLVSRRSGAVGVVWPSVERVTPSILITLINEELEQRGYTTLLSMNRIDSALEVFNRFQTDAILIFYDRDATFVERMPYPTRIPVLYYGLGGQTPYAAVDVMRDQAIRLAVRHLYDLGHRRIAYLGAPAYRDLLQQEKLTAYEQELAALGLPAQSVPVHSLESHDGYLAAMQVLGVHSPAEGSDASGAGSAAAARPSAIISGSYDLTRGILRAAAELELDIPVQLSLISYDHIPRMAELQPPISAVGVDVRRIARTIAAQLMRMTGAEDGGARAPDAPHEAASAADASVRSDEGGAVWPADARDGDSEAGAGGASLQLAPELVDRGSTAPPERRGRAT
ncbi:LacI family DNA-binding transcriptional regulator [Paenibacillus sp. IB182496]|uniref:LacI family DNA-binding transcriptional regulator n=1 Tax=Paenibacillus sabuli TaxID=2772509 RepID=A0A927BRW3_9BACL|nr:LacI family DNA-binding transcriptional regulator [Paenibacillus sabuli]MBD2845637.1 LacI family DNA-binding transcriptional regulator [Paenibacillus sabuli]